MEIIKDITLFFKEGTSDKEYRVTMVKEENSLYAIEKYFGRRGSTLRPAPKENNLSQEEANKLFEKIVNKQTREGYKANMSMGVAVLENIRGKKDSGLRAQLLNPIERTEMEQLLCDDRYGMMEKHNGVRVMVKNDEEIVFANRKGQVCNIPDELKKDIVKLPLKTSIDGENINGTIWAFDTFEVNGINLKEKPFIERYEELTKIVPQVVLEKNSNLVRSKLFLGTSTKKEAAKHFEEQGYEGIVFVLLNAPVSVGRPARGGTKLKFKFWESCSAIVGKHNNQSSIGLELYDGAKKVFVGDVKVDYKPPIGSVAEIRYLHVKAKGGLLIQPLFLGSRSDIEPSECTIDQIKYEGVTRK